MKFFQKILLIFIYLGLLNQGIESSNSTRTAIYSSNRTEWIIAEHSCYSMSMVVVSLYDSYGKDSIKYILNHCK
jgi:long-subunit acyl-CoA synthetase (AMP-forming)